MTKANAAKPPRRRKWTQLPRYRGKPTVRYAGRRWRVLKTRQRRNWRTGKNSDLLYIERMSGGVLYGLWTNRQCVKAA